MIRYKQFLKNKYQIYLLPLLAAGFIILVSVYILIPNVQNTLANQQTITVKQEELQKLESKMQLLKSVQSGNIDRYLADALIALPNEKDAAAQLITFGNLTNSTQAEIEQISLVPGLISSASAGGVTASKINLPVKTVKNINLLASSLQIRATNSQYLEFLKQLYNSRLLFEIDKMDINFSADIPDMMTAKLTLNSFYLLPPAKIGSAVSELPQITPQEQQVLQSLANFADISHLAVGTEVPQVNVGKTDLFSSK